MTRLIIVKRYVEPTRWGLHSNKRNPFIFDTEGLFTDEALKERLDRFGESFSRADATIDEFMSCAPIEWHTALKKGDQDTWERFACYKVNY